MIIWRRTHHSWFFLAYIVLGWLAGMILWEMLWHPNLVSSLLTGAHLMRRLFQKVGSIIIRHNYTASRYTWFWLNSKATAHVSFAEKRIPEYTASRSVCRINQRWGMLLEKCGLQNNSVNTGKKIRRQLIFYNILYMILHTVVCAKHF